MPNTVYALTNPAMPGLVETGMTGRVHVQRWMSGLHTTGAPLPRKHETPIKEDMEQQTET